MNAIESAAAMLGRRGGSRKSRTKAAAARENGQLGGRPKIPTRCPRCKQMQPGAAEAREHCRGHFAAS